jgi:hypothetical protein
MEPIIKLPSREFEPATERDVFIDELRHQMGLLGPTCIDEHLLKKGLHVISNVLQATSDDSQNNIAATTVATAVEVLAEPFFHPHVISWIGNGVSSNF